MILCERFQLDIKPLLVVLDLVDNSIDASLKNDDGAIHHALFVPAKKKNRVHINSARVCPSGITLNNTCLTEVRPLSKVLSVYNSAKGKDRESISENGIGLKQAGGGRAPPAPSPLSG